MFKINTLFLLVDKSDKENSSLEKYTLTLCGNMMYISIDVYVSEKKRKT
jgi:hypothetical protein